MSEERAFPRMLDWQEKLIFALRMKDVPGDRIGEVLAEVNEYVAVTGQTPEEAFGNPQVYARERAAALESAHSRRDPLSGVKSTGFALVCAAGGWLAASAAYRIGSGEHHLWHVPVWLALVMGVVLITLPLAVISKDEIRDPLSGRSMFVSGRFATILQIATMAIMLSALAALGWFVNR